MTNKAERDEHIQIASEVASAVHDTMMRLHVERGLPLPLVISGAHAEVSLLMAETMGGPSAAECCHQAADRLAMLPTFEDMALAAAAPAGRA